MLPYTELDKIKVDSISISGKSLNTNSRKLFENDKYLLAPLQEFYNEIPELDGTNVDGLIEHINQLKNKIDSIKSIDLEIVNSKMDFLKRNDCRIKLEDLFPCYKLTKEEVLAYFDNTTIHAYAYDTVDESGYKFTQKNILETCEDCENHKSCDS